MKVYRRYLKVDPSITERYASILLSPENPSPRPLEAAKLLLSLARKAARGEYTSPEGKSPYQLLCDWLEVVEKHAEEVGLDLEQADAAAAARKEAEAVSQEEPASASGKVIRFAGPPTTDSKDASRPYDEDEDPSSPRKIDIEKVIKLDGLAVYKDQAGRLWSGLALYWTKISEFGRVCSTVSASIAVSNSGPRPRTPSKRGWRMWSRFGTSPRSSMPMRSTWNR